MSLRRIALACPLLLLASISCGGHEPVAPSFAVVGTPASLTASASAFNQIDLTWQENSRNETGFEVHRSTTGPSGTFTLLATTPAGATTYSNGGLAGSTQYCYKVRAFRTTGRKTTYSEFTNTACATTPAPPVPRAPSAVNAVPRFGYAFDVTWTDNSSDETGFRVERSATSAGPWTGVGTTSANVTSLADYLVNYPYPGDDRPNCYRVFAVNSFGDSGPSNVDCTAMPATPTNLAANPVGGTAVDLTWTDNSAVEDGFEVWRTGGAADWSVVATLPANTTGYHDAGPAPDNTYWYVVYARKDGGSSSNSEAAQVVLATTPPVAPSGLGVQPTSSSSVYGLWLDQSSNETGFRIERSTDGGASWVTAGTTGIDVYYFTDQGLSAEQQVCYRVIAFNSVGESAASNAPCTTPPAGPTNLTVAAVDATTIDLAWSDNSAVEDGYEVWADDGCCNVYSVAWLGSNATTFQYVDPYCTYCYGYFVVAVKDGGYSDWSNEVFPTPPPGASIARVGSTLRPAADRGVNLTPPLKRAATLPSRMAAPRGPPGSTALPHGSTSRVPATRPPTRTEGKP
ncbi:MAG: hypothetical protein AUH81_14955 [Candidatus Rokubacteria bacterium 13_1_40CM_4_69_5]|nr:MAG: hypothetical protein AUH81_14955 [Candidatus Rokubacteria bacterium 13_1_40CM_4_69_5]